MDRPVSGESATSPGSTTRPASWRWIVLAMLVFVAADGVLYRVFLGRDLSEGTVLPPLAIYEEMARGELEPQPLERWHGLAMNDLRFVVWLVGRNARTLLTRPTAIFDAEQCYPARNSLALGEPGIAQGVVATAGYLATRDPIATYDLLLFALPLISALAMFLLVRDWSGSPAAGIVAGLLYGFHRIKTWEVVHPYVWDTAWTVLALWLTARLFEKPRWRDALALGACVSLQIAGSFYALLSAIALSVPFLGWLVWRHGLRRAVLLRLGLSAALALLAAWWVMGPYLELRSSGVLEPRTEQHFLLIDWVLPGGFLFPGWSLGALALLGLALRGGLDPRRRGDPPGCWPRRPVCSSSCPRADRSIRSSAGRRPCSAPTVGWPASSRVSTSSAHRLRSTREPTWRSASWPGWAARCCSARHRGASGGARRWH
jgi:hypothetical protein